MGKEVVNMLPLAMAYLKEKHIIMSQKDLAEKMDADATTLSRAIKGQERYLTEKFLYRFNTATNGIFNLDWLLYGEGEMLKKVEGVELVDDQGGETRPHFESVVSLGEALGTGLALRIEDADERLRVPYLGDYEFSVRARGRSMINNRNPERSIEDGAILACRRIYEASQIHWGEVYLLCDTSGATAKMLKRSDREGYIRCVPFNTDEGYEEYDVPFSDIKDIALVVGVIQIKRFA